MIVNTRGMSLIEVIIATAVISTAFLGFISAYSVISKSITSSRTRTLASNYIQEKIEKIKNLSYYRITPTVDKAFDNSFSPSVVYDTKYFPPEVFESGGVQFTRLTCVDNVQEVADSFVPVDANSDTGAKMITVTVIWTENGRKIKTDMKSLVANTNMSAASSCITGVARNSLTNALIQGAQVSVVENSGWTDVTDSDGRFRIFLNAGNYHLAVVVPGYFMATSAFSIASDQSLTNDVYLNPMSSGTLISTVWINDHLLISQVVCSTLTAGGFDQEFVELYNPTTSYVMVYDAWPPKVEFCYQHYSQATPTNMSPCLVYAVTPSSVPPFSYYLIANTNTITVCGSTVAADAYYNPTFGIVNLIINQDSGSVGIRKNSTQAWIDKVGWERNSAGQSSQLFETRAVYQNAGFDPNEQYVRRASTSDTTGVSGYGRAYDSDNNNIDFIVLSPIGVMPRNTSVSQTVVSGRPATGSIATVNDGLSGPGIATLCGNPTYTGLPPAPNPPYAEVSVVSVATGTWTVVFSSSPYYYELNYATVTANTVKWIPDGFTLPTWPATNYHSTKFSLTTTQGFVSGRVYNASGGPINPMQVSGHSTSANGSYFYSSDTGTVSVEANAGNTNSSYVSLEKTAVIQQGQVTSGVDFILSEGGRLRGRVTSNGVSPIPGVTVLATDSAGNGRGQEITDSNGYFLITNVDTGTYTVAPVLDSKETSTPSSIDSTVTAGSTVFVGTFTVSGVLGTIAGTVTASGRAIQTGVLIMATTSTISSDPVAFSTATLTMNSFYSTSSMENGTYVLDVRGSTTTTYNVYSWYPVISNGTVSYTRKAQSGVSVTSGNNTSGINFSW